MAEQPAPRELPRVSRLALDDISVADSFVEDHTERAIYCHELRCWYLWNGTIWQRDRTNQQILLARETLEGIRKEASKLPEGDSKKAVLDAIHRCRTTRKIKAVLEMARADKQLAVTADMLDRNDWLLTCRNNTLNLRRCEPVLHSPRDLITRVAPVVYDAAAKCPRWMSFLYKIFDGDLELITFVCRWFGYCLTGSVREQVMLFCYGTGANGKSVLVNTIRRLLGDYAGVSPSNLLLAEDYGDRHPTEVADLRGRRLVITSEPDPGKKLSESRLKAVVGTDPIKARLMHKDLVEFMPNLKLMLCANHKPAIRSTDQGTWRRILMVPFTVTIPKDQQDLELEAKLWEEAPGILNWCMGGLRDYLAGGLSPPAIVLDAANEYRQEQDLLGHFVATLKGGETHQASRLFEMYQSWCRDTGIRHPVTQTKFGILMKERGDIDGWRDGDTQKYARKGGDNEQTTMDQDL